MHLVLVGSPRLPETVMPAWCSAIALGKIRIYDELARRYDGVMEPD